MTRKLMGAVAFAATIAMLLPAGSYSQDDDLLGSAAKLTAKSSELQKVQDQLKDRREEVKKEAEKVKAEESKVEGMKAASGEDPGPLEGPFYLYSGAFSNIQSGKLGTKHPNARTIDGGGGPGQKFETFAEARAEAEKRMADGGRQRSYRIEDKNRITVESGKFGYGSDDVQKLPQSRIDNPTAPKAGSTDLDKAVKGLADRQAASEKAVEKYKADKAAYDKDLADYNVSVERLQKSLPAALAEAGSPTPTAADMAAPKGDYSVEDLGAIITKMKGQAKGDGSALAFVTEAAKLPSPAKWAKGDKVEGATLRPGTPIATFKADGTFAPGKGGHAAIYVTQNKKGIWVYDQYKTAAGEQRPVDARFIRFKKGAGSPSNDAGSYSVIKKGAAVPDLPPEKP